MLPRWQFWIDVGGTFTDVIARRPDGQLVRHKLLSSGVTKCAAAAGSTSTRVSCAGLADPDDFWRGYRLRLLRADGSVAAESTVTASGGTAGEFRLTDPLAVTPALGQLFELASAEPAPIVAIRRLLGARLEEPIPPVVVRLGTTRGTNALLTRRGARTAFLTTRGFGDILRIGYQNRPRLFELAIQKPAPLFEHVLEVDERVTAAGEVLLGPDQERLRRELRQLREQGVESVAICLLHAYRFSTHEELIERVAREVGFVEISRSSHVAPLIKLVARGDTTVVDAYLTPVLRDYVARLRLALGPESDLRILTSAGGLVSAEQFSGKDSVLSGPAGGVVGYSRAAQAAGFERAIGFDMGGTSTDVSRFDGRCELEYETEKAGVRIVAPTLAIETVAAGGGSICWFDGVKLRVGPDSAGADPGPLCYGRGGPLTITDINLFLGKLLPDRFPFPLWPAERVAQRLEELRDEVAAAMGTQLSLIELAEGFLQVANANMAKAIRSISVAKGYDPRDYVLVAFGGAAPQHACAIADELGIEQILNHPDAGLLSAWGAGLADIVRHEAAGVYRPYDDQQVAELKQVAAGLAARACAAVSSEGVPADHITSQCFFDLRYQGMDAYLTIAEPPDGDYAARFREEHLRLYGYLHDDRPLEIVALRVEAIGRSEITPLPSRRVPSRPPPAAAEVRKVCFHGSAQETGVYERTALPPGSVVVGPVVISEGASTTVIDPGWQAEVLSGGELLLTRVAAASGSPPVTTAKAHQGPTTVVSLVRMPVPSTQAAPSPIMLEIFNNHFAGIAEQMGLTLRNTASSVNVKERLDFSCALFTAAGELVVNAPHIPVHLGAMSETVKHLLADHPDLRPGDVLITNDPYRGGSHLPDVTVVTPVHDAATSELRFFTASRAHHAEIGGITPGSMPPFSRNLAEEGVLIRSFKVVEAGQPRLGALRELLLAGPYPTRKVEDNLADVSAQIAANQRGAQDLRRLIDRFTWPVVQAYMRHIQQAAERKMRRALERLPDGRREFIDHLDDGSPIAVAITIAGDSAKIDFSGTGGVLAGNLNANRAIVTAAVMYCLRCLIDEEIPLNQGVLAPIEIILPECLLNPPAGPTPEQCPAVVGGNVETSQRIVDVILGALRSAAASQGTMNNLLFGDATFGYYETICGGAGATAQADGASAVHTHMTNTRLTDPEVLEQRYPVRLLEFSIRRNSGGRGRRRGGDGIIRRIEFLQPLELSTVCQRRGKYAPYGLDGGEAGSIGRNMLRHPDGRCEELPGCVHRHVLPGDQLTIETPGGGGFGPP